MLHLLSKTNRCSRQDVAAALNFLDSADFPVKAAGEVCLGRCHGLFVFQEVGGAFARPYIVLYWMVLVSPVKFLQILYTVLDLISSDSNPES